MTVTLFILHSSNAFVETEWSEEYGMPMPAGRNVPLRKPYPIPEPTTQLPPVDAIKWIRQVDPSTHQRLAERYAQANPDWRDNGSSTASAVAPGAGSSASLMSATQHQHQDAAEALLASILPKPVKPEYVTSGKKEEDVDVKPTLMVKREEDRKFKVDPEGISSYFSTSLCCARLTLFKDVKLPAELIHGSVGQVKPETADLQVKLDEDGAYLLGW
jgi:hypothetical protein